MKAIKQDVNSPRTKKRIMGKDITLNVSFKDALIRYLIVVMLPLAMLEIDKHLIIYTAPVLAYLFITAITRFCVIKYIWHHYIKHEPDAKLPKYGEDPNYPEQSV